MVEVGCVCIDDDVNKFEKMSFWNWIVSRWLNEFLWLLDEEDGKSSSILGVVY